jgi:hypothetical protein
MDEQEHTWDRLYEYLKKVKPYTEDMSIYLQEGPDNVRVTVKFISQAMWEEFGRLSPWVGVPELRWGSGVVVLWEFYAEEKDLGGIRSDWERLG